jgi:hypothetical protein
MWQSVDDVPDKVVLFNPLTNSRVTGLFTPLHEPIPDGRASFSYIGLSDENLVNPDARWQPDGKRIYSRVAEAHQLLPVQDLTVDVDVTTDQEDELLKTPVSSERRF